MFTHRLEIMDLEKQCHTFTFWQSAPGFRSKSMGELDTQLVTVNAGGRGLMKATGGATVQGSITGRIYLRRKDPRPVAAESPQRRHILEHCPLSVK